jgi:ribosomal protein S18 acetylase RimI-like enzyme
MSGTSNEEQTMIDGILHDLSPAALSHAVRLNLYAFFRHLGRLDGMEVVADSALMRWRAPMPSWAWFNGVLCTRPTAAGDEQAIRDAVAYFRNHAVPAFTWWLMPDLVRADWERQLLPYGFRLNDDAPGMAVDLQNLDREQSGPPRFTVESVSDHDTLKVWTRTFVAGFQQPPESEAGIFNMMSGLGLAWPVRNYLGYLDGKPVATSHVCLGAGVAGIHFVSTLPEARRLGIGAAMTLTPLREAERLGYRIATLASTAMAFKVYERLGFRQVCRMEHFCLTQGSTLDF